VSIWRVALRTGGLGTLVCLLLAGCVVPAANDAAYQEDASESLQSATSEVRTAELALQSWLDGRMQRTAANVVVTDAESAIEPIDVAFSGVDPPSTGSDDVRKNVVDLLGDAQDALAQSRIALRRDDASGARAALAQLDKAADDIEAATERLK
jgi:hypothetical protein